MDSLLNPPRSSHPHGIHCLHRHGWEVRRWCPACRIHWANTCGQVDCDKFAAACNTNLAYQVLAEIERGDLPLPPTFELDVTEAVWARRFRNLPDSYINL